MQFAGGGGPQSTMMQTSIAKFQAIPICETWLQEVTQQEGKVGQFCPHKDMHGMYL